METTFKLAIDVGGTFTDVVLLNDKTGELHMTKTDSISSDPSEGVMNGINKIISKVGIEPKEIDYFVHGSTVATNAFLEGKGSRVALFTTEGFRDVIEIGRQKRPKLYDLMQDKHSSIVERRHRYGIEERIDGEGEVVVALNESSIIEAIKAIKKEGINSVAIVYLHSYINSSHEQRTMELIKNLYPECHVSMSYEVSPEFREYERTFTTVINAYLKTNTSYYYKFLSDKLKKKNIKIPYIMKSSGGVMTTDVATEKPVETLLSGPAGGVIAASQIAKTMDVQNIITLDMGGTSTDVSMTLNHSPKMTMESSLKGYPIRVPMIEMETIGAGGGSIGWIDEGGMLKVGPQSAGAVPGPACYDNGGMQPTITDANLVLGRIDPNYFLGGERTLNTENSYQAVSSLGDKSNLSLVDAAAGMVQIANNHMIEAIRLVTIRKGFDPKDFTLCAFGGSSPLHATEIAKELGIPRVMIPRASSELSAYGFLVADIRHDFSFTQLTSLKEDALQIINDILDELKMKGERMLEIEGVLPAQQLLLHSLDLRYEGQAFEISIPVGTTELEDKDLIKLIDNFHIEYERQYGRSDKDHPIEIVNYRSSAIGKTPEHELKNLPEGESNPHPNAKKGVREVFLNSKHSYIDVPVFYLHLLTFGNEISGPAMIDGIDTTIMIEDGQKAEVDQKGNLIILMKGRN